MKGSTRRFQSVSELEAGAYRRFQLVACGACGFIGRLHDATATGMPPELAKRKFQQMGWSIGQKASQDHCPRCVEGRAKSNPKPVPQEPMMVEPPRQPTLDDRRRIREALFAHYDEESGRYSKAHSDRSVAAALKVPFAWVSQVREALGFGPDRNEAADAWHGEIKAIREAIKVAQDEVLADAAGRFDALDKRLSALERSGVKETAA
ncbi:hypothetical protein [Brevundimonas balnearis]|uniref:Uncharacterized protein n=1 Tax=Brevundimonas balnearis TaxID=1572858 RepID=A0ABV6R3W2_9CAUL